MTEHSPDIQLRTDRLVLRPPLRADWLAYSAFMQTDAAQFFNGHRNPTEAWKSFGTVIWHWIDKGFGPFAVTQGGDDTCIGLVGPKFPHGWSEGEITWLVFGTAEGRGLAQEAARACLAHARDQLGWTTAVSYVDAPNLRSIRLAERLGAVLDSTATAPAADVLVYRHALAQPEAA